jgi:hypothetical protein
MRSDIVCASGGKLPSRKQPSTGHLLVDIARDLLKGFQVDLGNLEEQKRLQAARQAQQAQAELKGATVKATTAGVIARAMCADTPEKKQAVLSETEELCSMIRGEQILLATVEPAVSLPTVIVQPKQLGRYTSRQKFGKKMLKAYITYEELRDNGVDLSKGGKRWFPIYKLAFDVDPESVSGDTAERIKLRRKFNREYERYQKETA